MNHWYSEDDCHLDDFIASLEAAQSAAPATPHASTVQSGIPIYDCTKGGDLSDPAVRDALKEEWAATLLSGAGIVALKSAYADTTPIDTATRVFNDIMAEQRRAGASGGDHFGTNDRIWNALEKLCLADPEVFAAYFSNPVIALVCEAWLGPNYQITAQTNLVNPGGTGQTAHRDYHLGFQTPQTAARYPKTVHHFSSHLTLQGAVAHVDMPLASGPTKYLPFSQTYGPGYLAYTLPEFSAYFDAHHVQLPLQKGDAVFFNPATFHGAGSNTTADVKRLANLLQVSSAFGRAMESVNRQTMCEALFPVLLGQVQRGSLSETEVAACIAASAEGYPFPTSLDSDPPIGGLAPQSQADLMRAALKDQMRPDAFNQTLKDHAARRS